MKLEDIKVGMKVKLLGKHDAGDNYDNIEDWYKDCDEWKDVQQIKKQGFGVVVNICAHDSIRVADTIDGNMWWFLISDLEPYNEEDVINKNNELNNVQQQIKTPKEWLLTPLAIFTLTNGAKCITLGNGTSYVISNGIVWCDNLDEAYDKDLKYVSYDCEFNDIIKITYEGEVVWERKEEIKRMTLEEIEKELGYKIEIVGEQKLHFMYIKR